MKKCSLFLHRQRCQTDENHEYYKLPFVEKIDEETGYIYLKDLIGNVPFNNNELIRAKSKKLSEQ